MIQVLQTVRPPDEGDLADLFLGRRPAPQGAATAVVTVCSRRGDDRVGLLRRERGDSLRLARMHLRHLLIQNCKLMRQLEVPFVHADGSPRLWTVFVGENGTCKTTLLRAIAVAAAGPAFANNLVSDPSAYIDRRSPTESVGVTTLFGFSSRYHAARSYPHFDPPPPDPPFVAAKATLDAPGTTIRHWAEYRDAEEPVAVLSDSLARVTASSIPASVQHVFEGVRDKNHAHWFVAGYGVGRIVARPGAATEGEVPARDRMRSLFDARHLPHGTGFSDTMALRFGEDRARAFAKTLRLALIDRMSTPKVRSIELRGKGGANNQINLIESHRFAMNFGGADLKLPAVWLSQGYQAVISLVADIIGNVWLEAGEPVELDDMEGIVLVDELDLHLHPSWQTEIVTGLKAAFPRMQFIVTTHSPLVLAGCKADEVWMLKHDEQTGDVFAEQGEVSPMLLTASELYREFFGVSRRHAAELGQALRQYLEIASDPDRSDAEEAQLEVLRRKLEDNRVELKHPPAARTPS